MFKVNDFVMFTAAVGSITFGILMLVCPVSAKLCKRFGSRIVMVCGGIVCALGVLGSAFSPSLYLLYFTYGFVVGCGASMIYMAAFEIVPLYFDKHRSLATGMLSAGSGAGLLIMCPIVAVLLDHFDWRKSLMILAGLNLLPSILGCSITRRTSDCQESKKQQQPRRKLDVPLYKDPVFILVTCIFVIMGTGHLMPTVHLVSCHNKTH